MHTRSLVGPAFLAFALATLASCGGGGGSGTDLVAAVQDLDLDPDGLTTVLSFDGDAPAYAPNQVMASGGQSAVSTSAAGTALTVVWDERVTPSHSVRIGSGTPIGVTTSDASAPTFAITSATQVAGLGGDQLEIQFSGPRVVADDVVDPGVWTLVVEGVEVPFEGGVFSFDEDAQVLTVTTSEEIDLHADFALRVDGLTSVSDTPVASAPIDGVANGDSDAPSIVQVVQRLDEDALGRVVDLEFDEAMSPIFATGLTNYATGLLVFAQEVEQIAPETIRVRFAQPVVPGLHTVTPVQCLDAHGNACLDGATAVVAGSTVANAYSVDPELQTVSGAANDRLVVVTDQALAPSTATSAAAWSLEIGGSPVDLSTASFSYSLATRTLTVTLPVDHPNGSAFDLTPLAVVDVDGEAFAAPFSGTLAGDQVAPNLMTAVQNRQIDADGETFDVRFSEALDATTAEDTANYVPSGGQSVVSADLLSDNVTVRLVLSSVAVPGEHTLAIGGVLDLAGNALVALPAVALTSTDVTAPSATAAAGSGVVGSDNDTLTVTFDDLLVESDVEDVANWTVESPIGTPVDTSLASIVYSAGSNTAVMTLDGGDGVAFQFGADLRVTFSGIRDVAGNAIKSTPLTGTLEVEGGVPGVEAVWVRAAPNDDQVVVRFDEPIANFDDVLAVYRLLDAGGNLVATPAQTPALSADGRGVELAFGVVVVPGTHTLDVLGVTDLAGNPCFPVLEHAIAAEDTAELGFDVGQSAAMAVAGEANDVLAFVFDRAPSTWGLLDPANYTLDVAGQPIDLGGTSVAFDGDRTVTIALGGAVDLPAGAACTLGFDGLVTRQGVELAAPASEAVVVGGDVTAADVPVGGARIDALAPTSSTLVDFDEAVDASAAEDAANYLLEGLQPFAAERIGARTVRLSFVLPPLVGNELEALVPDLAGNVASATRLVTGVDVAGPLVTSVDGVIEPGYGGDVVRVRFSKPLVAASATDASAYSVTSGGIALDVSSALVTYSATDDEVTIALPPGHELVAGQQVSVTLSGMLDHAGFSLATTTVHGAVAGDTDAPEIASSFVNHRASATGLVVDVLFSEHVDPTLPGDPSAWTVSGGQTVLSADVLQPDRVRLTLATPFVGGDTVALIGLVDVAGNDAGPVDDTPVP